MIGERTLEVGDDHEEEKTCIFQAEELTHLLSYTANLLVFNTHHSENRALYCTYLANLDSQVFLKRVAKIDYGLTSSSEDITPYFTAYYNFHDTLTRLRLEHHDMEHVYKLGGQRADCLLFLAEFKSLTGLDFYNYSRNLTLMDILHICPNLVSLNFVSSVNVSDDIMTTKLAKLSASSNLKTLILTLPHLTAGYMNYITSNLTQLNQLSIYVKKMDMFDWVDQVGLENAIRFAQHFSMLRMVNLDFEVVKAYQQSAETNTTKMTQLFSLFGALKGKRNMFCAATMSDLSTRESSICAYKEKWLELIYDIGSEVDRWDQVSDDEDDEDNSTHDNGDPNDAFEIPLPDAEKSLIGTEAIHYLDIQIARQHNSLPYRLLKYVLDNYPHLGCLHLDCTMMDYKICLSPLGYQHRGYGYRGGKESVGCDLSYTTQENIKQIRFEGFLPTQEYLDLLSRSVPNVTTMLFADGGQRRCRRNDTRGSLAFDFDLTGFAQLKTCHFDLQSLASVDSGTFLLIPVQYVFIHLKYTDGEDAYNCLQHQGGEYDACAPIDLHTMQNHQETQDLTMTKLINIKCRKLDVFLFCYGRDLCIAEIHQGELQATVPNDIANRFLH